MVNKFSSISEFEKHINETPLNEVFRWEKLKSSDDNYKFRMTHNFAEATELLKHGWDSMAKKLETKLNAIKNDLINTTTRRAKFDVAGFQASVPRYLQGIPTSMINQKQEQKKQKVITLVKSVSYSAYVTTEEIMENSVKAMQIMKKIESQGYRVNFDIVFAGHCDDEKIMCKIRIKSASEKVNVSKMAFPLVHPSMLRRLLFRFLETHPEMKSKSWPYGYGTPINDHRELKQCLDENDYLLPAFIDNVDEVVASIGLR